MAEYHPLISRAVEGLENNTGEARRALYERARGALVAQLRGVTPALSESDITRERLALEEAIRKVEAEQARRSRLERPPPVIKPAVPDEPAATPSPPSKDMTVAPASEAPPTSALPEPAQPEARDPAAVHPDHHLSDLDRPLLRRPAPPASRVEVARHAAAANEPDQVRLDAALRALRDRVASGQEAIVPHWPRTPPELPPEEREAQDSAPADAAAEAESEAPRTDDDAGAVYSDQALPEPPRRRLSGAAVKAVIAVVVVAVIGALAAVGYRERASLLALYHLVRGPPPAPPEQARQQPKIEDRVGATQPDRLPGAGERAAVPGMQSLPAVAQRVVLYEEDPSDPAGKRHVGSVIWRTETVSPGPGLAPELAVKANIEIPERRITMAFSMVRNTDTALPASHTIDVRFNLPPGFPGGGVANVPGILMKQAEQTRGAPLAGIAVKVTNNVFLIGLSSVDTDMQRNTQLLKERTWFDIPIVYANGSRAILAMEKGTPGERAFNDAFTAWGNSVTGSRGARQ
jgi:hypothetical protein